MKKTLLIAAAALAAGIISTQASSVYSQNVVGYINQPIVGGGVANAINIPLQTTTNAIEQSFAGLQVGDTFYVWDSVNGGIYVYNYVGTGNGVYNWVDAGSDPIPGANVDGTCPGPVLNPGQGCSYTTTVGNFTNTWTGNVVLTNSYPLIGNGVVQDIGSAIPFAGSVETSTNLNFPLAVGDTFYIYDQVNGGYYIYNYVGTGNGVYNWVDAGSDPIPGANVDGTCPGPNLTVGQGFLYTTTLTTNTWNQSLILH